MKRKKKKNIYVEGSGEMKRRRIVFIQRVVGKWKGKGGERLEKM